MSKMKAFLKSVHIENYLSLRDVTLPLKPLTVLVGPNASGKSNILSALELLKTMMIREALPPVQLIQEAFWAGADKGSDITFELQAQVEGTQAVYELGLKAEIDNSSFDEELRVKDAQVISIQGGKGRVWDEDSQKETPYKDSKLALKSAGAYGHKPITNALTKFIKTWEFYNFQPELIRKNLMEYSLITKELGPSPRLDSSGFSLPDVLSNWYTKTPDRFRNVSESLAASTRLKIDQHMHNGVLELCLLEGYPKVIPLEKASDGTLRLAAYYTLLNEPELPPLIAIEEPERSLHPGVLGDITNILEQMAERSQVIITTHSSQLLDEFNPKSLAGSLGILLLRNYLGDGTEVTNLEDILENEVALNGWITDFGIGSAIFDSNLINSMEEEPVCQP